MELMVMDRKALEAYVPNKRLIERCKKKIEEEQFRDIPVVKGKVTGSSHEFPYIEQRFSVEMDEPVEAEKRRKNIEKLIRDIRKAEREMEEVETFIEGIPDAGHREIFTYRYIDDMDVQKVADAVGYTKGRISQIIKKYLKD